MTHTLVGTGVARLAAARREWLPQLAVTAIGAGLLPDADSWLYLIDDSYYGRYHRVFSHSIWALAILAVVSVLLARAVTTPGIARRFGWFVTPNLPREGDVPTRVPWKLMFLVAFASVYLHLLGDSFTGFGNVLPLWPWSPWDASMHAVSSFDVVIFSTTIAWHLGTRQLEWPRRREAWLTAGYCVLIAVYVAGRLAWGEPTVW